MVFVRKDLLTLETERLIREALRRYEPQFVRAFLDAVRYVQSQVSVDQIISALETGDMARALDLIPQNALGEYLRGRGVEPTVRTGVQVLATTMAAGGTSGQLLLPRAAGIQASLDLTNPEAVRYLSQNIPELIREINRSTRESIQAALLYGMENGRPIDVIARDIRGAIGLTAKQSRAISNFRRQLETGEMGTGTAPWLRRLSAVERAQARAIYEAGGTRGPQVNALVDRYRQSLINRRALDISRTEIHRAYEEGKQELWRQAASQGIIDGEAVRRFWIVTPDDRLRPSHAAIPGMNPNGVALEGKFETPFGPVHGPKDGNPELINCRCAVGIRFVS